MADTPCTSHGMSCYPNTRHLASPNDAACSVGLRDFCCCRRNTSVIVLTTHSMEEADLLCDDIHVLAEVRLGHKPHRLPFEIVQ